MRAATLLTTPAAIASARLDRTRRPAAVTIRSFLLLRRKNINVNLPFRATWRQADFDRADRLGAEEVGRRADFDRGDRLRPDCWRDDRRRSVRCGLGSLRLLLRVSDAT